MYLLRLVDALGVSILKQIRTQCTLLVNAQRGYFSSYLPPTTFMNWRMNSTNAEITYLKPWGLSLFPNPIGPNANVE